MGENILFHFVTELFPMYKIVIIVPKIDFYERIMTP